MKNSQGYISKERNPFDYVLQDFNLRDLSNLVILKHLSEQVDTERKDFYQVFPEQLTIDYGAFSHPGWEAPFPIVQVQQDEYSVKLSCRCAAVKNKLCQHQAQVLYNILKRGDLFIFFNKPLRHQKIRREAVQYGLDQETDPDAHFKIEHENGQVEIKPVMKNLQAFGTEAQHKLKDLLLPATEPAFPFQSMDQDTDKMILVIAKHRYYNHLTVDLYEAAKGKTGKIKNPLRLLKPSNLLLKGQDADFIKFCGAISAFQQLQQQYEESSLPDIDMLGAIFKNPLKLPVFLHNPKEPVNISAGTLKPVNIEILRDGLQLEVNQADPFFEISGRIKIDDKIYTIDQLLLVNQCFIQLKNTLYFVAQADFLRILIFFKKQSNHLVLHKSKYTEFQKQILIPLEGRIQVNYSYLKKASPAQIEEKGFDLEHEKLIYLSESEDFILITPVMRYGSIEVPVLSKKQIQSQDKRGQLFRLERDEDMELQFIGDIIKQHPFFYEQESNDSFYLHRKRFLEESWFLDTFENWRNKGIHILGFNKLKNNKLNPNKAEISIEIHSGTDWFETKAKVAFGSQVASLKHLHKSIRNKSRFVTLDDGTQGILPEEWLEKFIAYFTAGEWTDDRLITHKIKYATVEELYTDAEMNPEMLQELSLYKQKFSGDDLILPIQVPETLQATLRPYQQEGLNWLNFLDDFNFGGCLADDMGLGKTIQIIAFILSQQIKHGRNTNLVVVPASLIFNWKAEIEKFAPSIRTKIIYGNKRGINTDDFDQFEVVLTSYGTLLSDVNFLKKHRFNYIFLDESQNIKNPESQRYKAAKLLQSRNKIVLTGTPVENNTFDLYGQLSFACPGLLGSKQDFSYLYAIPIDQFKDRKRAEELQQKIKPFILRRTKEQVAQELPDKTEITLYCEMGPEQREVYEANKREIQDFILGKTEDELPKSSMHVLKSITRLRQLCNSAALLADGKSYLQASSKMEVLMEQVESQMHQHRILIFSQFVGMLDLIKKQLDQKQIKYAYLTGQTRNREEVVRSFQESDDIPVFLISLKAGGTGLNLTKADYVYLVDPWWNPAVENQAIDRVYRIGQHKNVMAVRLICPDTIEEKIMKLQAGKKDLVRNLIQTDGGAFKNLTKQALLGLLS